MATWSWIGRKAGSVERTSSRFQERAGRDVLSLDPAVREDHLDVIETEVLLDRLGQAEDARLARVEVELLFVRARPDRVEDGRVDGERVRVLGHPRNLFAVRVRELEVVLRRHVASSAAASKP